MRLHASQELCHGRAPLDPAVHQTLKPQSRTRDALTGKLKLPMRRCPVLDLPARRDPSQAVILLDPTQDPLAPLVVSALTHHRPIRHPNPRRDNMDVVVRGVRMPGHQVLRAVKPHLIQVARGNGVPLVIA